METHEDIESRPLNYKLVRGLAREMGHATLVRYHGVRQLKLYPNRFVYSYALDPDHEVNKQIVVASIALEEKL